MSSRVIVVSGGNRGLGGALARALLADGVTVATYSRTETEWIRESVAARDSRLFWQEVDAADATAVDRFARTVLKKYGRIDGLVNNAASALDGLLALSPPDTIKRLLAVNLESPIVLTRACVRAMLPRRDGAIVNVSSVNGIRGHKGVAAYGASKAGLDGLTRCLARELGEAGIRVNSVCPGFMETEMISDMPEEQRQKVVRRTPLGRLGTTEDVVGVIRFLLSDAAKFITGQVLVVDGGLTC